MKQGHEDGITPAIGHPLEGLTRGTTTHLGQELSAIRIQIAEVPLLGSQLAEKRQFGHLALEGARALARSTLPEPLEGRPAVRGLGLEQTVELGSPLGAQQGLDQGVRSLLCATARRTDKSYDSVGCWKDEPLGAQPLTSEAKENLRSIVLKGPFEPAKLRVLPSPVTGASRSRGVPEPR